jgi:hypothetical protein
MKQAEEFDLGCDDILPPYYDAQGKEYPSLEKLVDACVHYYYSRTGKDGLPRLRRDGRGHAISRRPKQDDE